MRYFFVITHIMMSAVYPVIKTVNPHRGSCSANITGEF